MTKKELEKLLKTNGWEISEGKKHSLATHPNRPGIKIPIPRHRGDLATGTVKGILKDAGLE